MLSYSEYMNLILHEGIIKIDQEILDFLESAFVVHFLGEVEKKLNHSNVDRKLAINVISKIKSEYKKHHDGYVRVNKVLTSDQSYLGLNYKTEKLLGKFNFHVGSKSFNNENGAYFSVSNFGKSNSIHVAYDKELTKKMNQWLSDPTVDKLELIIKSKRNEIEHELAHMVELLITDNKS